MMTSFNNCEQFLQISGGCDHNSDFENVCNAFPYTHHKNLTMYAPVESGPTLEKI